MSEPPNAPTTADVTKLRERIAARPADPLARVDLAIALVGSPERDAAVEAAVALIGNSLDLGAFDVARAAARRLAETFDAPDLAILEADAAMMAGDRDGGIQILRGLAARAPRHAPTRIRLAALAIAEGDGAAALTWVEPVAGDGEEAAAAYLQTLIALDRADEAVAFAADAAERYPASADVHLLQGLAALASDRPAAAIAAFSEALRLDPERPEVHYDLAVAFALDGAVPAALGVVDAGLARNPTHERLLDLKADLQDRVTRRSPPED